MPQGQPLSLGFQISNFLAKLIINIYHTSDIENVENYRGITLLSVVGKLLTSILNNRLNDWAENYNVYIEAQTGFRKGMGTTDNIFILHGLISHCI